MKTRRYKKRTKRTRRLKQRSRRRQRGGVVITKYLGGIPVTNKRNPTLVFRPTDENPREFSAPALFDLPDAFENSQDAGP